MRVHRTGLLLAALALAGCTSHDQSSTESRVERVPVKRCDESWQLGRASYEARWVTEKVITLIATGEKPGSAYEVCLGESHIRIHPPQYELRWKSMGTGDARQTPFKQEEKFNVARDQTTVTVNDRDGKHVVPIKDR